MGGGKSRSEKKKKFEAPILEKGGEFIFSSFIKRSDVVISDHRRGEVVGRRTSAAKQTKKDRKKGERTGKGKKVYEHL